MKFRNQPAQVALRSALCVVAFTLFAWVLLHLDIGQAARIVGRAGPAVLLAFVPQACAMALDTQGLRLLLAAVGRATTWPRLYVVRIALEAIHLSVPGGAVASDTATPFLLGRLTDANVSEGVVVAIARKCLVMRAHGFWILTCAAMGYSVLAAHSRSLMGVDGLPWLVAASSLFPFVLSMALGATLGSRRSAERIYQIVFSLPSARLRDWLLRRRSSFTATDALRGTLDQGGSTFTLRATLCFLGAWAVESIDTWVLLRIVGAQVDIGSVMAIEAGLSLVRSAAVFAPSGIGIQDMGYILLFRALGASDADATMGAFVLLKRGKELGWTLAGYSVIFGLRATSRGKPVVAHAL